MNIMLHCNSAKHEVRNIRNGHALATADADATLTRMRCYLDFVGVDAREGAILGRHKVRADAKAARPPRIAIHATVPKGHPDSRRWRISIASRLHLALGKSQHACEQS